MHKWWSYLLPRLLNNQNTRSQENWVEVGQVTQLQLNIARAKRQWRVISQNHAPEGRSIKTSGDIYWREQQLVWEILEVAVDIQIAFGIWALRKGQVPKNTH